MLTMSDDAPSYWGDTGGRHWNLALPCGASASALRSDATHKWNVFPPEGDHYEFSEHLNDDEIITYLKTLLKDSLIKSLALLV